MSVTDQASEDDDSFPVNYAHSRGPMKAFGRNIQHKEGSECLVSAIHTRTRNLLNAIIKEYCIRPMWIFFPLVPDKNVILTTRIHKHIQTNKQTCKHAHVNKTKN